jgi:Ca2+-transporting ATPase
MMRPPRDPAEAILSRRFIAGIAFHACVISAVTLAAFFYVGATNRAAASTAAFMTLSMAQSLHVVNARSRHRVSGAAHLSNPLAIAGVAAAIALQLMTALAAPLAAILNVVPLPTREWLAVAIASIAPAMIGQLVKRPAGRS